MFSPVNEVPVRHHSTVSPLYDTLLKLGSYFHETGFTDRLAWKSAFWCSAASTIIAHASLTFVGSVSLWSRHRAFIFYIGNYRNLFFKQFFNFTHPHRPLFLLCIYVDHPGKCHNHSQANTSAISTRTDVRYCRAGYKCHRESFSI